MVDAPDPEASRCERVEILLQRPNREEERTPQLAVRGPPSRVGEPVPVGREALVRTHELLRRGVDRLDRLVDDPAPVVQVGHADVPRLHDSPGRSFAASRSIVGSRFRRHYPATLATFFQKTVVSQGRPSG